MATSVIMPRQGQSVESCIISRWFKSPGELVNKGEVLFAYETDKASFEAEAEADGILIKRLFEEGDEVPVLKVIAYLGTPGEIINDENLLASHSNDTPSRNPLKENFEPSSLDTAIYNKLTSKSGEDIKISPRAKNRAASLGILIERITGSGPNGRIMEKDILDAAKSGPSVNRLAKDIAEEDKLKIPSSGTGLGGRVSSFDLLPQNFTNSGDSEIIKVSNVRKIIAEKMHESLQNSAQLTHHTSADASAMLKFRSKVKEGMEKGQLENITINDMVCYAVIKALKKHPNANCHFLGNSIRKFNKVHLGMAVDTERGLMVPTLRNADDLTIQRLSKELSALANKCKKGNIDPELLASESASFTVSNLGSFGVELFTPVINLPQVGILGINTLINRPADLGNGVFGIIPFIGLSLTYDHRALDGAPASAFLREIKLEIEKLDYDLCMI